MKYDFRTAGRAKSPGGKGQPVKGSTMVRGMFYGLERDHEQERNAPIRTLTGTISHSSSLNGGLFLVPYFARNLEDQKRRSRI